MSVRNSDSPFPKWDRLPNVRPRMKPTPKPGRRQKDSPRRSGPPRWLAVAAVIFLGLPVVVGITVVLRNRAQVKPPASAGSFNGQVVGVNHAAGKASSTNTLPAPTEGEQSTVLANEGTRLLQAGNFQGAETAYRAALKLTPDDEDLHYNLGIALSRLDRLDEAEAEYRAALKLFPEYPEVHNNLGNLLNRQKRYDEAITHFREALKHQPDYASAHNNYGIVLQQQGRSMEAFEQFQQAVQADTNYWEARFNLGNSAAAMGQADQARAAFNEVLRQRPDFEPARRALQLLEAKWTPRDNAAAP